MSFVNSPCGRSGELKDVHGQKLGKAAYMKFSSPIAPQHFRALAGAEAPPTELSVYARLAMAGAHA
jgi:hypothetical protein